MATVKISELGAINSNDLTASDLFHVVDTGATSAAYPTGTNRRITAAVLAERLAALNTSVIPPAVQTALELKLSVAAFNSAGLKIALPVAAASTVSVDLNNVVVGLEIDGVSLASLNRVLLKNQSDATQNGIYIVGNSAPPSRASDFDQVEEINKGYVLVNGGVTQRGSGWVVTSNVTAVGGGFSDIVFTQFSSAVTNVTKATVNLGNVDNTSDKEKPISDLTAAALALKQNSITGAATTITASILDSNRAVISNADGRIAVSSITTSELNALDNISGNIQTQLDSKASKNNPSFTGTVTLPSTTTVGGVAVDVIPAGAVMAFAMQSAPSGWLECNGQAIERADLRYIKLWQAISTLYGAGNGSTTFNVPDLRGYFVRGHGTNSDLTQSGTFAIKQNHDWKSFSLQNGRTAYQHDYYAGKNISPNFSSHPGIFTGKWESVFEGGVNVATSTVFSWDSSEIRPKNIAMMYCIKL